MIYATIASKLLHGPCVQCIITFLIDPRDFVSGNVRFEYRTSISFSESSL
jgi:hypothetical protein